MLLRHALLEVIDTNIVHHESLVCLLVLISGPLPAEQHNLIEFRVVESQVAHSGDQHRVRVLLRVENVVNLPLQRNVSFSKFGYFIVELSAHETAYINKRINITLNELASFSYKQLDAVLAVRANIINVLSFDLIRNFIENLLLLVYAL